MNTVLVSYIEKYCLRYSISHLRQSKLLEITAYIKSNIDAGEDVRLNFICTHNSRRSHFSQIWAQVAARYFGIPGVYCFSGGTEVTAFNPRVARALTKAGFTISSPGLSPNPVYLVNYSDKSEPIKAFSKTYDDNSNPQERFAAVMTCSDADASCPVVIGARKRISIPYQDPKNADDTAEEESRYDEICQEIANEMFFVFSNAQQGIKLSAI
jgi:protein-tyrosine-phosphatase